MKFSFMPLNLPAWSSQGIEFNKMFDKAKAAGFSAYDASENDLRFATTVRSAVSVTTPDLRLPTISTGCT